MRALAPAQAVTQVKEQVRHAVGASRLARLAPAIELVDAQPDGSTTTIRFGTARGEFRIGDESGFDGSYRWQLDSRRGHAVPLSLRQHEKAAWPIWVRSHWWLNPASGITATLIPTETDSTRIALRLSRNGGVVPATLYIDRATMLPSRLVVPYDRGPFEARFGDWRSFSGVRFAHRVDTSYRHEATARTQALIRLTGNPFTAPPGPAGVFDNNRPASLAIRRGPDFASGLRGHSFVQARVDGGDAGWWLVDSGADGMIIDEALADRLGMPVLGETRSTGADGRPRRATIRRGRSFSVGRLTYRDPIYLALDLSEASAPPGQRRAGVIGYDVFARSVVEYARDGDELLICDPSRYRSPAGLRWQSIDFMDQTPAVIARIEGNRSGLFQIDTGAAGSVDFYQPFVEANRLLEGRETREVQSQGAGGTFSMRAGRIGWIDLGGRRFADQEVGFRTGAGRDGAGVIGRVLLRPFRTVFDYPGRRIGFLPWERERGSTRRCD